jgi:hypothetical protein
LFFVELGALPLGEPAWECATEKEKPRINAQEPEIGELAILTSRFGRDPRMNKQVNLVSESR